MTVWRHPFMPYKLILECLPFYCSCPSLFLKLKLKKNVNNQLLVASGEGSNEKNAFILFFRQKVVDMFHHAYDGYIKYAYPYDELRPLTCDGHDTWGRLVIAFTRENQQSGFPTRFNTNQAVQPQKIVRHLKFII